MWWFWVETWSKKRLIICYIYTNVANRIMFSFVWRKFFKCRDWRMMRWVEEWKKAQAWGCPCITLRNIQEVQASKLGDASKAPLLHRKNQVTFQDTIFLLLHALCVFLGASVVLFFLVGLVLFAAINGWTPTNFLWRRCTCFHLPRTVSFSLLSFNECSYFSATAFGFHFCLNLHSDLVISLHQGVFLPLIFIGFHQKRWL
jgi:hypothetical protein